jgi:YidC/Oxa1 family membrane protein insertase
MGTILYNLTIFPIAAAIEVFYLLFARVAHSPGIAIIGVSVAVNILALPLYAKAEKWQAIERAIQKRLKPKVDDIKAVFKGDERLMILATYYRQNGYHPFYALRSSYGLLLQVPFFIAAYAFIAGLPELHGRSFLFIKDLATPDALLAIGGLRVNALPLLMTLVNVLAAAVYLRGLALREKVQLYGIAALFLVLLYASPAGLTLYWTLNNLFSLAKNLVFKAKRPLRAFYIIMAALAIGAIAYMSFLADTTPRKRLVVDALCALVLATPLFAGLAARFLERVVGPALEDARGRASFFFACAASLAVLVGLAIPLNLISSSTQEFSFVGSRASPFGFVLVAFCQGAGIFLVWPVVLYYLFGDRAKATLAALFSIGLFAALLDAFAFGGAYGTISRQFAFPDPGLLKAGAKASAANIAALLGAAAAIAWALAARKAKALRAVATVCLVSLLGISGFKAFAVGSDFAAFRKLRSTETAQAASSSLEPVYALSKTGKNVVVFMLDRAINAFAPIIMKEDPALAASFRGFVLYPETLSFGGHTLLGAPPLFGGYDYTPDAMNERPGEALVDKHDEALRVMPRLFSEAGWDCAVSDASWARYSWIPDNSIFDGMKGVRAFNLEGSYTQSWLAAHGMEADPSAKIERNLTRLALFRIAPMAIRFGLYDNGKWWDSAYAPDEYSDFVDKYAALDYLPGLVRYQEAGNCFDLIVNNATHDSVALSYPGYEPTRTPFEGVDPRFVDEYAWRTYQVNMAALRAVGRFLDSLRAKGVFDNTKVVIVADHGFDIANPAFSKLGPKERLASSFNPLLMVKDFGAKAPLSVDGRRGSNADTPAIAAAALGGAGLKNPFTGRPLRTLKADETVRIVDSSIYDPASQPKTTLRFSESDVIDVRGDIFEASSWSFRK